MSFLRGENGQFLPRPWPLDKAGKPKREALAEKDAIAGRHRKEKPYSKEAKEKRRKGTARGVGTRKQIADDPKTTPRATACRRSGAVAEKVVSLASWPSPGRAFVSRKFWTP
jgi:hypothetical protein